MALRGLNDTYTLNNGVKIPVVGFGTWQTPDGEVAEKSVLAALNSGYRHIDTAAAYGNEESVGRAIKKSGIRRDELFVTTKLWNSDHGYENTKKAIDTSLMKLGLDYLDLYLIHWPNPVAMRDNWAELNSESWQAMEEAQKAGKIRAIGVSNFRKHHLDALLENADVIPAVNQIYLNPSDLESDVRKENDKHQILSEAYSPLGTGDLLGNELVNKLAQEHGKSPAQILIRWSLEHGFLPLPKSVHEEYIKANGQVFDFSLSADEMKLLDGLEGKGNSALDPDQANF
ncbi:aldo/keto reductase [Lactobacillus jensenii]|jgi:2,5-didehydrogluconate reductase|uniref:Aldo/keto reductase n=1 Tax=Lactobacillus jensenii TaxID=109790 RepID=A0A5N1IBZ5_LACJE|nr:aldo/keto reductase [Lactobacillus jensenii]ERJ43243.1 2,5-diketo-D-gluconic acid reductase [Lactobacillus jensenii MD IIE-70(2)]APT14002.1 2,5-diketo-D-gluconic acid reductase [Lactobacillus jensenii]EEQ23918.1 oxidoreductase, aldo/keto reductase family protein [Lactobacillus jensenii 269-3]EEX26953.1 glyoxal reductase [Lactobacillus jensenii SJ-7A-US]KAA9234553.1 aldo/keto reductase [Lactobacillus jensenii]